jgi:Skp family chaperone for outer membrane proteins
MQIHRAFVLLALGALLVWGTAAQDEPIKIGIVDIDQAISSTDEGKAAREEFARKQREAEQQMQPLMDRYKGVEEELKAKKFVLSEEALFQKQLDLAEMRNLIQNKIKELEGQLQVDQKRLEGPLTAKLVEDRGRGQDPEKLHVDPAPGHPECSTREARRHRPDHQAATTRRVEPGVTLVHPTAIVDPQAKLAGTSRSGLFGDRRSVELAPGVVIGST